MHVVNVDSVRIHLTHRQAQFLAEAARDRLADQAKRRVAKEAADGTTTWRRLPALSLMTPGRSRGALATRRG